MRSGSASPRATIPYFGSGSVIVCPPSTATPALLATSIPPCSTWPSISSGRSSTGHATMFKREERLRAHRVHVGERVRGGDPAPVVRVVDDRREEVERGDQRLSSGELDHGGVVARIGGDEHVRAELGEREGAEHGLEIGRSELAPAPGAVAEGRESSLLHGSRMPHCRPCGPPSSGTSSGSSSPTSSTCPAPATSCTPRIPGRSREAVARSRRCSSRGWPAAAPSTRRWATTNGAPGRGGA